ncbi:MAG TPA: hypothetical protein VF814_17340 [Casimicrobiaceae bacterium]
MKKIVSSLLALILVAGVLPARAEKFQDAAEFASRSRLCKAVAGDALRHFLAKQEGRRLPSRSPQGLARSTLVAWSIDYGRNKAVDGEDAYKHTFLVCMDNINRLQREESAGFARLEVR